MQSHLNVMQFTILQLSHVPQLNTLQHNWQLKIQNTLHVTVVTKLRQRCTVLLHFYTGNDCVSWFLSGITHTREDLISAFYKDIKFLLVYSQRLNLFPYISSPLMPTPWSWWSLKAPLQACISGYWVALSCPIMVLTNPPLTTGQ